MIQDLFKSIDNQDAETFGSFLSDDCLFRFGNQEAVKGKELIVPYVAGFFDSIRGLSHELLDVWEVDGTLICHGQVTYRRHSGSELCVPFCNVMKLDGAKISEYLIFSDNSTLYTE